MKFKNERIAAKRTYDKRTFAKKEHEILGKETVFG